MAHKKVAVVDTPSRVDLPIWRELLTGVEYVALKASPVYYGFGVPKGDGEPVVIVPGFMGTDAYLLEMYLWLKRIGYKPYFSRIGHNAQCPDKLTHRLLKTVNRAYTDTGRPVHIIGHSFGGVLARGVATRTPHRVASVITMGSPFRGTRVSGLILSAIKRVRNYTHRARHTAKGCFTPDCACGFMYTMSNRFPERVPLTAIYTKKDGVVDWETCIEGVPEIDVEVKATHVGLAWNAEVYRTIAERLANADERRAQHIKTKTRRAKKSTKTVKKVDKKEAA